MSGMEGQAEHLWNHDYKVPNAAIASIGLLSEYVHMFRSSPW